MEREWGSAAVVALAHLVTDQCTGGCTAHGAQRAAEQGIPHDTTGHGAYAGTDLCTAGIGGTAGREQGNGCCGGNGIKAGLHVHLLWRPAFSPWVGYGASTVW